MSREYRGRGIYYKVEGVCHVEAMWFDMPVIQVLEVEHEELKLRDEIVYICFLKFLVEVGEMLVEVYFSMRYINNKAARDVYNFYRRTGGGGHHWFILSKDKVDLLIHRLAEAAMEYPNWASFVKKRGKTSEEIMNAGAHVKELPREPSEFLKILREYIEFEWRDNNGIIEIATHRPGKIIGKGGRNIRALRKHLNRHIKVVQAYYFARKVGVFNDGTITLYEYAPAWGKPDPRVIAKLPEEPYISMAFKVHTNKSYGFAVDSGWIAPWHIQKV